MKTLKNETFLNCKHEPIPVNNDGKIECRFCGEELDSDTELTKEEIGISNI